MALKDRPRTTAKPATHGEPCSVGQVYRTNLDDHEELAEIDSILYDEGKNAREVWEELQASGYKVKHQTVNRHRGKTCRCFTIDRDLWCMTCRRHLDGCAC